MLLFLTNKKKFFIQKKKNTYNLIVINKNILPSKNRIINKEMKQLLITNCFYNKINNFFIKYFYFQLNK